MSDIVERLRVDWIDNEFNEVSDDAIIEIESLRQQLENMTERYNVRKELADHLSQQLAASQAREQQLREALNQGYGWAPIGSTSKQIMGLALALPQDTSALEAMITKAGEVMRERCAVECETHYNFSNALAAAIRALPAVTLDDLKGGA